MVVVVVFDDVVVCVFVVTGAVGPVVLDFVVVVVTGATCVTEEVVVTTGDAEVTGAGAGVVVVAVVSLWCTAGFLRWTFLWCTALLCGAAATDDVVLDVVEAVGALEVVEVVEVRELEAPPVLPQPATTTTPAAITASNPAFIAPTPLVALGLAPEANNG